MKQARNNKQRVLLWYYRPASLSARSGGQAKPGLTQASESPSETCLSLFCGTCAKPSLRRKTRKKATVPAHGLLGTGGGPPGRGQSPASCLLSPLSFIPTT